jgi:hypothetical protein
MESMSYIEFNRDFFYCNKIDSGNIPLPGKCTLYPISKGLCSGNTFPMAGNSYNDSDCNICQNMQYQDYYNSQFVSSNGNYEDIKEIYYRAWLQSCNLGIGICVLLVGIYYQV